MPRARSDLRSPEAWRWLEGLVARDEVSRVERREEGIAMRPEALSKFIRQRRARGARHPDGIHEVAVFGDPKADVRTR